VVSHDIPISMFHSRIADGGSGIPLLVSKMHILCKNQIPGLTRKAPDGSDPMWQWYNKNSATLGIEVDHKVQERGGLDHQAGECIVYVAFADIYNTMKSETGEYTDVKTKLTNYFAFQVYLQYDTGL